MNQKVFITGVTGYLGSSIASRLVRGGYSVYGLTRQPESAAGLSARGIHPVIGDLCDPDSFMASLKNCDAAIHSALDVNDAARVDHLALDALRSGSFDGRVRRILYTSCLWVLGDSDDLAADDDAPAQPIEPSRWRAAHEETALDLMVHGTRVVVLRPGIGYGGSRGVIGDMFTEAHEQGVVRYPGDGSQYWCMVHRDDFAEACLRALERTRGGERYLVSDGAFPTAREVAESVAAVSGATARPHEGPEAPKLMGPLGDALLASMRERADRTRFELGWTPRHTSFVDEARRLNEEWLGSRGTPVA